MTKLKSCYIRGIPEAGCDEAGRGCIAGPVFAAAVILPEHFDYPGLDDSKKLTEKKRLILRTIIEKEALAFAVASVDHNMIDKINILNASILAMHKAIDGLSIIPEHLIIDGNRFKPYRSIPHRCIVDGDALYMSVAAASVLAKTYRDEYIVNLHEQYPHYGWNKNKGYATAAHVLAIKKYGMCPFHRRSFYVRSLQPLLAFE